MSDDEERLRMDLESARQALREQAAIIEHNSKLQTMWMQRALAAERELASLSQADREVQP